MREARRLLRRSGPGLVAGALLLAAPAPGSLVSAAAAHGGGDARVRTELDPLPAALEGVRFELHHTVSPQVVIENRSRRVVEVLDDEGVPFLRVGPEGTYGNVAARAWYATYGPGLPVPEAAREDAPPRWVRASAEPAFGWFEPRLDTEEIDVPHAWIDAGRAGEVGRFALPLRVDGKPVSLRGRFRYEPQPKGRYASRLTSSSQLAPGVRVRLLPGGVPGLLVESTSEEPLTVFGAGGEPFLRFGRDGVEANVRSPAWRESARGSSRRLAGGAEAEASAGAEAEARAGAEAATSASAAPLWTRVAPVPRYSWIEPRAAGPDDARRNAGERPEPHRWRVPLQLGDERLWVTGEVAWMPFGRSG